MGLAVAVGCALAAGAELTGALRGTVNACCMFGPKELRPKSPAVCPDAPGIVTRRCAVPADRGTVPGTLNCELGAGIDPPHDVRTDTGDGACNGVFSRWYEAKSGANPSKAQNRGGGAPKPIEGVVEPITGTRSEPIEGVPKPIEGVSLPITGTRSEPIEGVPKPIEGVSLPIKGVPDRKSGW